MKSDISIPFFRNKIYEYGSRCTLRASSFAENGKPLNSTDKFFCRLRPATRVADALVGSARQIRLRGESIEGTGELAVAGRRRRRVLRRRKLSRPHRAWHLHAEFANNTSGA